MPTDNPLARVARLVLGHRNPQGIAWDAWGGMWAAEFGQDPGTSSTRSRPAPTTAGPRSRAAGRARGDTSSPLLQWSTDDASPSGLTAVGSTLFMAGLGGEKLFEIQVPAESEATPTERFAGDDSLGRIRDVLPGPDGTLWLVTNNTDGRGSPSAGDDRIVSVPSLEPRRVARSRATPARGARPERVPGGYPRTR